MAGPTEMTAARDGRALFGAAAEATPAAGRTTAAIGAGERAGSRQPRLAFLLTHTAPGGAQELWRDLAAAFAKRGWAVDLCALYRTPEQTDPGDGRDWVCFAPDRPASFGDKLAMARSLGRYLRHARPDAVVSALPLANVLGPLVGRFASPATRFITSHHTPVQTHNRALDALDGVVGTQPNVAAVVGVSRAVCDSLAGKPWRYRAKRATILNALPPEVEERLEMLRAARQGRPRARRLVATGRLAAQKNYGVLIRALAHMPDVELAIVGSGPDREQLEALAAERGVASQVAFMGQRGRREALDILAAGDVFVQPSLFEGHSLGLIEAAKLGLPLVVSDVPVQVEGVTGPEGERCGIVVGAHDDEGLAREVRALLDDPKAYEAWASRASLLGAAARFETMVEGYETLVRAALGARSPQHSNT